MGSSQGCDLGVRSEVGILATAGPFVPGLGMGRGGKQPHFLSTLEAPPLGGGGSRDCTGVYLCVSVTASVYVCVCFMLLPWESLYI